MSTITSLIFSMQRRYTFEGYHILIEPVELAGDMELFVNGTESPFKKIMR